MIHKFRHFRRDTECACKTTVVGLAVRVLQLVFYRMQAEVRGIQQSFDGFAAARIYSGASASR
jgi:hypothetical protein